MGERVSEASEAQRDSSLEAFLISVERKAYRMAELSTGNVDDALDIVQDAMEKFVRGYADIVDDTERRMLFFRILSNRLIDWSRRQRLRRGVLSLWPVRHDADEGETAEVDPLAVLADQHGQSPEQQLGSDELGGRIEAALSQLSVQQRQCFLLRHWEGLSVTETAQVMKVSEGSVKTHLSRARAGLQKLLADDRGEEAAIRTVAASGFDGRGS